MVGKMERTSTSLDVLLNFLADGAWHDLNEISTQEGLRKLAINQLFIYLHFCAEYDFVELRDTWRGDVAVLEARLTKPLQNFIKKIKWIERQERQPLFSRS